MKPVVLALALSALLATPALAGPPWISIEFRAHNSGASDGWLVVRVFHHGTPGPFGALGGRAVGIVGGRRTELPLRFEALPDETGAFLVPTTWTAGTAWVLVIALDGAEHGSAGAVVGVGPSGEPAFVRFPRTIEGMTRAATDGEVDALLQALATGREPPRLGRGGIISFVRRNPAPLAVLGAVALSGALGIALVVRRVVRWRSSVTALRA
jgi:hypothetical protein